MVFQHMGGERFFVSHDPEGACYFAGTVGGLEVCFVEDVIAVAAVITDAAGGDFGVCRFHFQEAKAGEVLCHPVEDLLSDFSVSHVGVNGQMFQVGKGMKIPIDQESGHGIFGLEGVEKHGWFALQEFAQTAGVPAFARGEGFRVQGGQFPEHGIFWIGDACQ